MTRVAIVGCGPAGLLAAHAVAQAGHTPVVYSDIAAPSPVYGGVYLHQAIPDVGGGGEWITFRKLGSAEGYAEKVYGHRAAPTSWQRLGEGQHPAWALRPVYDALWRTYGEAVQVLHVNPLVAAGLANDYPLVLSSAPLPMLCQAPEQHRFPARAVWYKDTAPSWVAPKTMVYNGHPDWAWFRSSDVFGHRLTEYGDEVPGARAGRKVLLTTCTCHPRIVRIGRWGE